MGMPRKKEVTGQLNLESYALKEIRIRLAEGNRLYGSDPLSDPRAAVRIMQKELSQYDREVFCIVNLDTKLQPINFNIVSVGTLNKTIVDIPNVFKACILSNAASFLAFHNHPSGDLTPSREDIVTTGHLIKAGKLLGIPCLDHIIIGKDSYHSLKEHGELDFDTGDINVGLHEKNRIYQTARKGETNMAENKAETAKEQAAVPQEAAKQPKDIIIKFAKGLCGKPFTAKSGKSFVEVKIPNADPKDKTPWETFILPENAVHEDKFGKGLYARLPEDGHTTVSKSVRTGMDENGKGIYTENRTAVTNVCLKEKVEAYKQREKPSVLKDLMGKEEKAEGILGTVKIKPPKDLSL